MTSWHESYGPVGKIRLEQQEYERQREEIRRCTGSSIQAVNCVILNGVAHAASVSHRCSLGVDHGPVEQSVCACACGHRWMTMK